MAPPKKFLEGLRKICDDYGILLIDDEIQVGTDALKVFEYYDTVKSK